MGRLSVFALAWSTVSLFACAGPNFKDYCDKYEGCIGGNDKDKAACVDAHKSSQKIASAIGCGSEFDDYYTCLVGASSCRPTATGIPCMTDADCTK
jgi:Cys-rich protein (TIGR04453 family)